MSCPNSMLATMFDPDSGMEPGYSENGVYFLDVNPKYFSVILDWLRHRKVMADNDTNLDNVAEVAKFFGLQELVEELKMRGGVVVTSDEGEANPEYLGGCMGLFLKETESWFRQAGGEMYLYQHSNGNWYINDILHDDQGFLFNTTFGDSQILPRYGWQFLETESDKFILDEKLRINDVSKNKFCNTITLSSSKFLRKEILGEFYRCSEEWQNGWPVFKNKTGMKLHVVRNRSDEWYVSNFCTDENFISSGRATSCPAHPKSSLSELYGHKYWQYWSDGDNDGDGNWIEDETFKVECDVHTFDE